MQHKKINQMLVKAFTFAALWLIVFTVTATVGVDSYEIYLNDKLMLKQSARQPLTLKSIMLTKANANDKLTIYYSQCNATGKIAKGRSIAVRDKKGVVLKEWKFADVEGTDTGMVIPVMELLQLEKNNASHDLSLYYAAQGLPEGRMLIPLQIGEKGTT